MVLLGMVPVLIHTPPMLTCFSMTATRLPALVPWMAARCPPGPEPITIRSNGCILRILRGRLVGGDCGWGRGRRALSINDGGLPRGASASLVTGTVGDTHRSE